MRLELLHAGLAVKGQATVAIEVTTLGDLVDAKS